MMFGNDEISLGDRFTTGINASRKVCVVEALVERPGIPLHVRLVAEGRPGGSGMLMSVSALLDPRFWRRAPLAKEVAENAQKSQPRGDLALPRSR